MTTRSVEDKVESLFQAIQNLVQIEAARAVYPLSDHEECPSLVWHDDFDDEALSRAQNVLKRQLVDIV